MVHFKFRGSVISMRVKSFINDKDFIPKRLTQSLKLRLKKSYNITLDEYLVEECDKKIIKCGICGFYSFYELDYKFSPLGDGFIIEDFYIKYTKNYYCKGKNDDCSGKKLNPNSVKFISLTMGLSEDESLKYIHNRNKTPFYVENHIDEDSYREYQRRDLSYFNGDKLKYNEYKNRISLGNSKQRYINEYGVVDGVNMFDSISKSKDNSSFNYFLLKYNGDKKKAKFEFDKKNSLCKQTLENFIIRYGESGEEKFIKYNNIRKQCNSIEHYKKLYGEEGGEQKRMEWLNKIRRTNFYSKESFDLFYKLDKELNIHGLYGKKEHFLRRKENGLIYFYDYTLLDKKKIIEYNGKIWHPDKEVYSLNEWDEWKHPYNKNLTNEDVYEKDKDKIQLVKECGYEILIIWDFEKDKLKKMIKFING